MNAPNALRILIVDDSATARASIRAALELDGQIDVVGEAATGDEATRLVQKLRPHIVTMDVYLSASTGIDATRSIMQECPTPILIVTAYHPTDPGIAFKAIAAGALDVCTKLPSPRSVDYAREQKRLVRLVRSLASVPVVRRYRGRGRGDTAVAASVVEVRQMPRDLIAVGASTGGPPVVRDLLRALPADFTIPVVVVQHIATGFGESYGQWLSTESDRRVVYVRERASLDPATVYLAPDDRHLRLTPGKLLVANDDAPVNYQRPSIDTLFSSIARELGARAAAVLLTGMGCDGANGLLALRERGALTIAQSPETCAVDGMPASAIGQNAAELVLRPEAIADKLVNLQRSMRQFTTLNRVSQ